ncbi:cyclin-F2-2-like [Phragmites australis]|uniref:cyclin-F2-2-like n=1 Tax=Phragmites australis TaxID=29695 RepID=UPI002D779CD2|nr:cyclin-F2-2-like [Phragmites australis]
MEIMDPFAYELLARPPPPGFDPFSCGGSMNTEITTEQLDNYFRAIGVLPPLPPADVPPTPSYTTPAATLWGAMDYAMEPLVTCELYAAALDVHVHPGAVEAPEVSLSRPAPPVSHDGAAAIKNSYDADIDASLRVMEKDARERPSPDYLNTTQGSRMDPVAHLGPATLHRAVSYADRFLSARLLADDASYERQLRLLGSSTVYAAVKYEDRGDARKLNARDVASDCGFASSQEVLDTERALVAALRYGSAAPRSTPPAVGRGSGGDLAGEAGLKPSHDSEQVQRWSRELDELTGYKPVDVHDGVHCMYRLMPDPGFDISPLFFADSR